MLASRWCGIQIKNSVLRARSITAFKDVTCIFMHGKEKTFNNTYYSNVKKQSKQSFKKFYILYSIPESYWCYNGPSEGSLCFKIQGRKNTVNEIKKNDGTVEHA